MFYRQRIIDNFAKKPALIGPVILVYSGRKNILIILIS